MKEKIISPFKKTGGMYSVKKPVRATREQQQKNLALAKFMGLKFVKTGKVNYAGENEQWQIILPGHFDGEDYGVKEEIETILPYEYHCNWEWLMGVGEKIRNLLREIHGHIPKQSVMHGDEIELDIRCAVVNYSREKAIDAMLEFIMWHDENKEKIQQWLKRPITPK